MIIIPSFRGLVARVFTEESGPESGSLYAWGYNGVSGEVNRSGQLGLGDVVSRSSPHLLTSASGWSGSVSGWTAVSSGFRHTLGLNSGKLYSWGNNLKGQLGSGYEGINFFRSYPVIVGGDSNWTAVSAGGAHSLALKSDGTLWSWGYNNYGQLGLGDHGYGANRSSPVQVGGSDWFLVSAGYNHSLAIKTDGTLWAWGRNDYGQLGLGDYGFGTHRSSPAQVGGTDWSSVSAGGTLFNGSHSLGIRSNGTLWAWGYNGSGQLGLGDHGFGTHRSSPAQVDGTDWSSVSAGGQHSLAIKTTNSLWSWGKNLRGQLGKGDTTDRSAPSQITGSTWKMASAGIEHSGGIDISDKMFFWGFNNNGQVGDNSTTNRNSPVPIMSSNNWLYIASMKDNSSFAIKKQT